MKKITAILVSVMALGLAMPALAETGAMTITTKTDAVSSNPAKIACVGSAVDVRESAIDGAVSTYTVALNAAYSARAAALQAAYSQSTNASIKAAVKAAWSAFRSSVSLARKAWQTSRNSAWTAFRTSAKACKAPAVPTDSANSVSEASGN